MQPKDVVYSSQIIASPKSKAEPQHVISIDELCVDPQILDLEEQAYESLKNLSLPQENYEKDQAAALLANFKIALSPYKNDYGPIFKTRLEDLVTRPCAVKAVKDCWHLPFNKMSFRQDIQTLSSMLNGMPMKIRKTNVESIDLKTGLTSVRYPSVKAMNKGIPVVASLINNPCCPLPILSAFIAWIYLYRLHLFKDGNGRVSRHIINIALRNYGLITEPKVFSSVKLYQNMRSITQHMTGETADIRELLIILYSQVFECSVVNA